MNDGRSDWLNAGAGDAPVIRWAFTTDAPLVAMDAAAESGEVFAADESGSLYRLDRRGRVATVARGFGQAFQVAWSNADGGGYVAGDDETLLHVSPRLDVVWTMNLPDRASALACDPFGRHVAFSLPDRKTRIYDSRKKKVCDFETLRPLSHVCFGVERAEIIGAADHGLLCRHRLDGTELWNESSFSNAGDLAITGDVTSLYVAGLNHGIRIYDGAGRARGSFVLEGTPRRVAISYAADRIAASTVEGHLYWIDGDGDMLWATICEEPIERLCVGPFGRWLYVGFETGRIVRLDWDGE